MKKLVLLSTVMCMVSSVSFGMEVKPYVEGRFSENFLKSEYKDELGKLDFKDSGVMGGSLEVGVKLDQFRVGLEGYYNDKMEDYLNYFLIIPVELKSKGLFLNGYYDFKLPDNLKKVKPYVSGGIGYSWLKETIKLSEYEESDISIKDKDWGWNISLGCGYELNQNLDLTLGYRYENLGKIKDSDSKNEFTNHKVSLGLRYTF